MKKDQAVNVWMDYGKNPVISIGPSGSLDQDFASWGSVLRRNDLIYLYYSAKGNSGKINVCLATSRDGRNFVKYDKNPILDVGPTASWDALYAYCPWVWEEDNEYRMIYTGCDAYPGSSHYQAGLANSVDGIHWEKSPHNPVFNDRNRKLRNRWKKFETEAWGIYHDDGDGYYMLYNSVSAKPRQIFIAYSEDLLSWKPVNRKPFIPSQGSRNDLGYMKYCACVYCLDKEFFVASAVSDERYMKSAIGLWHSTDLSPRKEMNFMGYIVNTSKEWKSAEVDTPFIIQRSDNRNLFDCYYGGRSSDNKWTLGVATGELEVRK